MISLWSPLFYTCTIQPLFLSSTLNEMILKNSSTTSLQPRSVSSTSNELSSLIIFLTQCPLFHCCKDLLILIFLYWSSTHPLLYLLLLLVINCLYWSSFSYNTHSFPHPSTSNHIFLYWSSTHFHLDLNSTAFYCSSCPSSNSLASSLIILLHSLHRSSPF
jgi:hypothetical protein